jgi:hypothetical protein
MLLKLMGTALMACGAEVLRSPLQAITSSTAQWCLGGHCRITTILPTRHDREHTAWRTTEESIQHGLVDDRSVDRARPRPERSELSRNAVAQGKLCSWSSSERE